MSLLLSKQQRHTKNVKKYSRTSITFFILYIYIFHCFLQACLVLILIHHPVNSLTARLILELLLLDCINGWQRYRTGCIKYFTAPLTRSKANKQCTRYRTSDNVPGKLVKIPSNADNDHLVSLAPQAGVFLFNA